MVAFLLVNKVYSPQYVIWLLPLAVLARPRWRDMLIWQACEIFYFFAVWMHIADFFVAAGERDWVYALAVVVRIAGQLYLVALVVRDILQPWNDPVRCRRTLRRPARRRPRRGHRRGAVPTAPPH